MSRTLSRLFTHIALLGSVLLLCSQAEAGEPLPTVQLDSIPPGAKIMVKEQTVGTTPARLQVPPGRPFVLVLKKSGFEPESVQITPLKSGQVKNVTIRLRQNGPAR